MSLVCWLPLTGTLENKGISNVNITGSNVTTNASGKIGSCYSFNGSSSYIKLDQSFVTNNITEFSYACWVKFNSTASACLFSARTATNTNGISLFVNNSGNILYDIGNERRTKAYSFSTGTWYHIAFTYKKGSYKKIYVNGAEIDSVTSTGTMTTVGSVAFIGASQNANTTVNANYLNGYLNDVRIWNDHCLSAAEVHEISQGLVLHYKLNDPVGFTDLIARGTSWNIYNNHNNTNMPSTLVATGGYYDGDKIYRETCTPTDNSLNSIKTTLHSHGVYNWGRTFAANTKYVFWIYYKPISHPDTVCGGTASNIGGWTEIPPVAVGGGWYRVGQYRNGTVTSDKTDSIFVSFKVPSATTGTPIIIDWASPHLLQGTTEIPPYDYPSTIIQDSGGYGHNGTINGTLILNSNTARYSAATYFNGTDAAIQIPFNDCIKTDDYTVSVWTYKSVIGEKAYQTILGGPSGFELEARSNTNTSPLYRIYNWGGGTTAYDLNKWNLFTFVRTASDSKLYVNGELKLTGTAGNAPPSGNYFIGAWKTATQQNYDGYMSDFRIYCTALSADDILSLYHTAAKIDNLHNIHTFEYIEDSSNIKLTKQGQFKKGEIQEDITTKFYKTNNTIKAKNFIEF